MTVDPSNFFDTLVEAGVRLFTGVPDSLLKHLCAAIEDRAVPGSHVIAANEGNAVALATGFHLASGGLGAVYLQNSGLGNTINPLTSLAHPRVYSIPMLLVIGWRGEPGLKDEPQHVQQGRITQGQLDLLEIPHRIIDGTTDHQEAIHDMVARATTEDRPVALLVRKGAFSGYRSERVRDEEATLSREAAIGIVLGALSDSDLVISTTGKPSREVFEYRVNRGEDPTDFLTVGGMGHTSSVALGAAMARPDRRVVCLDGDGSVLMHMGALAIIGSEAPPNLVHVMLNNRAHESVGGQPTVAGNVDFGSVFRAVGFSTYHLVDCRDSLATALAGIETVPGPHAIEVIVTLGSRSDLGRPTRSPVQNKTAFMKHANVR